MKEFVAPPELKPAEPPPEARQLGAVVWLRQNLFNSWFNSIITVLLAVGLVIFLRGALSFLTAVDRQWDVISPNATNYAVEVYPRSELTRIWVSMGVVSTLLGLSSAGWRPTGFVSWLKILAAIRGLGVAILAIGAIGSFGGRWLFLGIGLGLIVLGQGLVALIGESARQENIPTLALLFGVLGLLTVVLWVLPIAGSTKVTWTVQFLIVAAGHLLGRLAVWRIGAKLLRQILAVLWVLSLPVIYLQLERSPELAWSDLGSWMGWLLPIYLIGGGVIYATSVLGRDRSALINTVLLLATLGIWLVSVPMIVRLMLLVLLGFSLASPTFAASESGRRNFLWGWTAVTVLVVYLVLLTVSGNGLPSEGDFLGGFNLTLLLATGGFLLSFPLGLLLALGRTSTLPIFRLLSTGFIEVVRGIPLITVLFFADVVVVRFFPPGFDIDGVVKVIIAIALFSAAYLAENVRGGLQSIPKGQYEAARSMGMTSAQMTMLISLPQALRAVIPAIVGQTITLFKDTSLVAIVGLADFFRVARDIVPGQPAHLGSQLENLIMAAVVYWIFTFTFSRASLRLERKLGVGTR